MSEPSVMVLVLNWNGYDMTAPCLVSLAASDYANQRILLVDNGSADGSGERLHAEFPEAIYLNTGANLGYAGGNNAGFRAALAADADFVLVLNNDTLVEPDCVSELVRAALKHDAGIVSARIFYEWDRTRLWFAGGAIDPVHGTAINLGLDKQDGEEFRQERDIDFASGCAMLVRRDAIETVKGFDERYFLYFEEVDFCVRARAAGHRIVYAPRAVVWHKTRQETGKPVAPAVRYYMTRNRWLFMRRLYSRLPLGVSLRYGAEQARIALALLRRREWKQFASLWAAHRDAALGRFGART